MNAIPLNAMAMSGDLLRGELRRDEGVRRCVYQDSLKIWSIAVGRNVDGNHGGGLSDSEIDFLLDNDIAEKSAQLDARIPWWRQLSDARQRAMVNMAFMGVDKFMGFHRFLAAMQAGDWRAAIAELDDSLWSHQVDDGIGGRIGRADRVAALILAG